MVLNDLLWVAADPAGRTPKETRTQIRKQVMRCAVEAKKRKFKKPGVIKAADEKVGVAKNTCEDEDELPALVPNFIKGKLVLTYANGHSSRQRKHRGSDDVVPAQLPLTGIEKLVTKHGLDRHAATQVFGVLSLETLCTHFLNAHPEVLAHLVTEEAEHANDYFGHVVRHYGHIQCLDDAMQAVVAQVQANLSPHSAPSDREILLKYGKALRSLQEAINSASWEGPEVLCATQLLALFEALNGKGLERWRGHIQGAAKLMKLRGPGKHRSTFDTNLFLNLYPAIVCESFMKCQTCLFTDPAWQDFIASITDHDDPFSERGHLNMSSANLLFKAVNSVPDLLPLLVEGAEPDDPRVVELAGNFYRLVQDSAAWFEDFDVCVRKLAAKSGDFAAHPRLCMTYAMGSMVHMAWCRIFACLVPSKRARFERMAQTRAAEILQLVAGVPIDDHRQRLILRQEKNLAVGTILTAEDWGAFNNSGKLLDLHAFLKWCQIISDSGHRDFGDLTDDGAFVRFSNREMAKLMSGQPGFAKDAETSGIAEPSLEDAFHYWEWQGHEEEQPVV